MGVLESRGKVLDFFLSVKKSEPCEYGIVVNLLMKLIVLELSASAAVLSCLD